MNYSYHAITKSSGNLKPQEQYACRALRPYRQNDRSVTQYFPVLSPFPCTVCIVAGCQIGLFPHTQQTKWAAVTHQHATTFWGLVIDAVCVRGVTQRPLTACHIAAVRYKGRAMSYQWTSQQFLGKREAVALFSHRLPHPWASFCTCHSYHALKWFFKYYIKSKCQPWFLCANMHVFVDYVVYLVRLAKKCWGIHFLMLLPTKRMSKIKIQGHYLATWWLL